MYTFGLKSRRCHYVKNLFRLIKITIRLQSVRERFLSLLYHRLSSQTLLSLISFSMSKVLIKKKKYIKIFETVQKLRLKILYNLGFSVESIHLYIIKVKLRYKGFLPSKSKDFFVSKFYLFIYKCIDSIENLVGFHNGQMDMIFFNDMDLRSLR